LFYLNLCTSSTPTRKVDIGTQTPEHDEQILQSLSFLQRIEASYEAEDTYHLKVLFRRQDGLEKLGVEVEEWFRDIKEWRGKLGHIHTHMQAYRFKRSVQSMRKLVENFYLHGMDLLCQVNQWFAEDNPNNLEDALVSSRARYRLGMCLFQGLGALGVWTTLLGMRERELPVEDLPIADYSDEEEDFVEHDLLASC
jgi:hypothetical protein